MSRPSKLCLALLPLMSIAWALSIPAKADTIRFDGGIREDIPSRYRLRFEKWKAELLSTEFGKSQWETYSRDPRFVLTIRITEDRGKGAGTDNFSWDADGHLVGA